MKDKGIKITINAAFRLAAMAHIVETGIEKGASHMDFFMLRKLIDDLPLQQWLASIDIYRTTRHAPNCDVHTFLASCSCGSGALSEEQPNDTE